MSLTSALKWIERLPRRMARQADCAGRMFDARIAFHSALNRTPCDPLAMAQALREYDVAHREYNRVRFVWQAGYRPLILP